MLVVEVWRKLCARHLNDLLRDRSLHGQAKVKAQKYAVGSRSVKKSNGNLHMISFKIISIIV
jgi:hypothetical protein